ncbi:MAG: alpha/beta hydrolase [Limosilactobacillus pontis]|uniref:Hydrolase n=1 Tax=Limosilactobacillus pontis TaxID=35787 RepID=A0A2J6NM84_9LACO|nr:alpha/beta hydrolase [Limosilactobacillus pontis]PMB82431.1 hydrolase [Limosilactobacillus pontis]
MQRLKKIAKVLGFSLGGLCLLLLLTQAFLLRGTRGKSINQANGPRTIRYSEIPTILIPGWGGNTVTYNHMINHYQDKSIAQKVMTVWVSPRNHIRVSGNWHGQKNALIQVLFDWNYDASFHPQVSQLRHVLIYLNQHYGIKQTNIIAHSWGGTEFMHAYMGSKRLQRYLRLNKLIFLGVPVEESLSDRLPYHYLLIHHSKDKNFHQLRVQMKDWQLNYPITIYNLMGSKEGSRLTDGEVPHIQSEMLKALIQSQSMIKYHQKIYANTTHSQLHSRPMILKEIEQILWGKEN